MSKPLVSVCITAYNHAQYIRHCLESVLTQTLENEFEILVGDDASKDDTEREVKAIMALQPGRITYLRRSQNLGAPGNLRALVQTAGGKYITHLDGDDYWLPGKLAAQVAFMRGNPQCVACYTNAWVIADDGQPLGVFNNVQPEQFDLARLLRRGNYLNHSSLMYRAEHKDIVVNLPSVYIDYHLHLKLAQRGSLGYLNVAYVVYRQGSTQSMIRNSGDTVRKLYLKAVLEIITSEQAIPQALKIDGLSDFWARLVRDSLPRVQIKYLWHWAIALKEVQTPRYRTVLLKGIWLAAIMLCEAVYFRLVKKLLPGAFLQVIYRR